MAEPATRRNPTVFVVDDDDDVRASLTWLIGSVHLQVRAFASASEFLDTYDGQPGCLLLDVRMPGMTGLELQDRLRERAIRLPVIFITGHGDVPMAMRAVRAGALYFFEKPFPHHELIERVHEALRMDADARAEERAREPVARRYETLTRREREVMGLLVTDLANRTVADRLGISVRTVEVHRAHIMEKMRARGLVDLVRMAALLSRGPGG